MNVKICGLREHQNVMALSALNPTWMGFIFYEKSSRYFYKAKQPANLSKIPENISKVGVFVNESSNEILDLVNLHRLDYVQLHGNESPRNCAELTDKGVKVIKAFSIAISDDFIPVEQYASVVDYFLFDSKGNHPGGNGISFDWSLFNGRRFTNPFLLSGGIHSELAMSINNFKHPDCTGIDINSRFETSPAEKDIDLIYSFLQKIS